MGQLVQLTREYQNSAKVGSSLPGSKLFVILVLEQLLINS